jgi:hypothetical protein
VDFFFIWFSFFAFAYASWENFGGRALERSVGRQSSQTGVQPEILELSVLAESLDS